jgi:hypothetical protein
MKLTRKKIIIGLVTLFVILPVIAYVIFLISNSGDKSEAYLKDAVLITRDKDTGSIISDDPNLTEQGSEQRKTIIFGLETLIDAGVLTQQTTFIKDKLNSYAKDVLKGKYETLTIRPQDLVNTNGVFTSTLRLGQSETFIPVTITATNVGETRVVVTDDPDNTNGGSYDSGTTNFSAD